MSKRFFAGAAAPLLAAAAAAAVLSGCALQAPGPASPAQGSGAGEVPAAQAPSAGIAGSPELRGLHAFAKYSARGKTVFRCRRDSKGLYWAFVRTDGKLYAGGREAAAFRSDGSLAGRDGSRVALRAVKNGPYRGEGNLRDALFTAKAGTSGMFRGARYATRTDAEGGMPRTTCSPSQENRYLRSEFTAVYSFWR
jgi:hypothetical protein